MSKKTKERENRVGSPGAEEAKIQTRRLEEEAAKARLEALKAAETSHEDEDDLLFWRMPLKL